MGGNKFKWTSTTVGGETTCYEGENSRFVGCIELAGEDLHGNQMWYASLFDKEGDRTIPVNEFGAPFTSAEAAKEAIMRAMNRRD